MIKILITADTHFRNAEHFGIAITDNMNDRLYDKFKMFEGIVQTAIDKKVDYFMMLGDVFDYPNPPENLRFQFLKRVARLFGVVGIKVIIISGNHGTKDWVNYNLMSESYLAEVFCDVRRFSVVSELREMCLKNTKVAIVPDVDKEDISAFLDATEALLVFGHLGITKAKINDNFTDVNAFPIDKLSKFRMVFLGDYHKPQKVDNCIYCGSPFAIDKSETEYEHSVLYVELPENPDERGKYERIPIQDTIAFSTYTMDFDDFDCENGASIDLSTIKKELSDRIIMNKKNILNIDIGGIKGDVIFDFSAFKKDLLFLGFYDVRFDYDLRNSFEQDVDKSETSVFGNTKDIILGGITEYCKEGKKDESYLKFALNILGEAREAKKIKSG